MNVQKELKQIAERNKRVEADKAWEVSGFRMGIILVFTYVIALLFMVIAGIENPWLGALVPVIGYFLSTLSLPSLKKWWLGNLYLKKGSIQNIILGIGILGMVLSVIGTLVEGGSLEQKILFLVGASFLITTAFWNRQKMFVALQAVILVGAVLGFFPGVLAGIKFLIMASSAVVATASKPTYAKKMRDAP